MGRYTEELIESFRQDGAILENGHFVLGSQQHSREYFVAKEVTRRPQKYRAEIGLRLIEGIEADVDVFVGVATTGNKLAAWAYRAFREVTGKRRLRFYKTHHFGTGFTLSFRDSLRQSTVFAGANVLVVEDVVTTGGTANKVIELVRQGNGRVVGVVALCTHGRVMAETMGVPEFAAVIEMPMETFAPTVCQAVGPCAKGVPVNTEHGHGASYLRALESQELIRA